MPQAQSSRGCYNRSGFTLAELLVAVTIVILLVALLLPALNRAYQTALRSADSALIHQLAMACEAYHQVFYEYPPSRWVTNPGAAAVDHEAAWPPPVWDSGLPADGLLLTGTAKLFAALSGFNAVGCYDPNNPGVWDPSQWVKPCGELTYRGVLVDTDHNGSEDRTYGPYFEPKQNEYTTVPCNWSGTVSEQTAFASRFELANTEIVAPILYYRAQLNPVDGPDPGTTVDAWEIYIYADNYPLTNAAQSQQGQDPYAAVPQSHPLYGLADGSADVDADGRNDYGIIRPGQQPFPAAQAPFNANSFILISPGPDGEYFTEDDIRNF